MSRFSSRRVPTESRMARKVTIEMARPAARSPSRVAIGASSAADAYALLQTGFAKDVEQAAVDEFIAAADRATRHHVGAAIGIGDEAAGLAHKHDTRRDIPGHDAALPISVAASGGDEAEV